MISLIFWAVSIVSPPTLLVEFQQASNADKFRELRDELIPRLPQPYRSWQILLLDSEAAKGNYADVRILRIHGDCQIPTRLPYLNAPARPPLGWTDYVAGEFLPYAHADCTRIGIALRAAHPRLEFSPVAERQLVNETLARVLAHELTHLARNSPQHDHSGDFASSLSLRSLRH